jgi:hypothetical protein
MDDSSKRDRADIERAAHSSKNEGEGSQSGARDYNERTRSFVESGQVEGKAKEAEKAIEGKEGEALKRAEQEGKRHAKGEDPALRKEQRK